MIKISKEQLYIQVEPKIDTKSGKILKIRDLASVICQDKSIKESVLNIEIIYVPENVKSKVVFILDIIEKIQEKHDNVKINVFGNPEILINIEDDKKSYNIFQYLKILLICIILSVGAALAIIYFHRDVNMEEVHKAIYYLIVGKTNERPLILQIPYSIGLGIGMATFFNHISKKKWKKEPSPLDIEMYMYNKNINEYVLDKTKHIKQRK
ncbi:stage V sporulation protein AA [Caldisalinibacter kiritimatiensis]|uniref:Stage V sporulation protein AA (SpoVAA) n=1 Tax=Caldisalinibacter kiritimatiensis TaxID=1304284 RepID=R1CS90_9FIRM|nr:stage V sporulation protein AA [Caldisalinibacter kiritimatiensis]EOD01511.1 Stage V sporulation protein AA (SpoVAA) [Caldisalinibacter kiritimatiensis]